MMARKAALCFVMLGFVVALLTGCWLFPPDAGGEVVRSNKPRDESPQVAESEVVQLVEGNSRFALDLFRVLRTEEGNLFFSPYSISVALAMAFAGAHGATAAEMADVLRFTLAPSRLHPAFNSLALGLSRRVVESGGEFRLTVANSFWGQKGRIFLVGFLDTLSESYGAGVYLADFATSPEPARIALNNWVSRETDGKIKDLIPVGAISPLTRLVLANAIYMKGLWPTPFLPALTIDRRFRLLNGEEVYVPTMERRTRTQYARGDGYEAVRLPLSFSGGCEMVVLVPDAGQYDQFEVSLDAAYLDEILGSLETYDVHLFLPKFRFSSRFELAEALSRLGMSSAFGSDADFSGMDGTRELSISGVIHESFVAVDEYGVEAAAATAVILPGSAPPSPMPYVVLRVDRPFLFLLRDSWTGTVLFVGRVLRP